MEREANPTRLIDHRSPPKVTLVTMGFSETGDYESEMCQVLEILFLNTTAGLETFSEDNFK